MKIYLTGATGFIGKALVKKLVLEGHKVTVSVRKKTEKVFPKHIIPHYVDYSSIEKDIIFFKNQNYDGVIHLASLFLNDHKSADLHKLIDSNLKFGLHILECATKSKVKWFINTGTYWQHFENISYSPVNLYSATKQAFEDLAAYYTQLDLIKFVTLKLFDTYGPNDTRKKIFNIWYEYAESGKQLEMSPGEQLIDISYIDDVINAYTILANHLNSAFSIIDNCESYFIKAEKRYTLRYLSRIFEEVSRKKLNIIWGGRKYKKREIMIPYSGGKTVPGWTPMVSIKTGIKKTLDL